MMIHAEDMRADALLDNAPAVDPRGGDAAVARLTIPSGEALVIAIDSLVSGVHFRAGAKAEDVAHKAVAVNLSDLAAMGATPVAVAVSVTSENLSGAWLEGFRRGLATAAKGFRVRVAAAEINRGPLMVTLEAFGHVPLGSALRRSGARPADHVYVTGTLGDAGLGLAVARGEVALPEDEADYVLARLDRPEPRLVAGRALRALASAAIDISDGLAGDLAHILEQSGVGATVDVDRLPLSPVLKARRDRDSVLQLATSFGDDYELCFTVTESRREECESRLAKLGCGLSKIGVIEDRPGLRFTRGDGRPFEAKAAYDHFPD